MKSDIATAPFSVHALCAPVGFPMVHCQGSQGSSLRSVCNQQQCQAGCADLTACLSNNTAHLDWLIYQLIAALNHVVLLPVLGMCGMRVMPHVASQIVLSLRVYSNIVIGRYTF